MNKEKNKIAIIGAGNFASALASQLSLNKCNEIVLFCRNENQAKEINESKTNSKYFSSLIFNHNVSASTNYDELTSFEIIILCIPSSIISSLDKIFKNNISKQALIINMSKGLAPQGETICSFLKANYQFENVVTLKGPSFGIELINNAQTILTLGYSDFNQSKIVNKIFENTAIHLDYTTDIEGVEYLSVLKNIYAIYIGHVDGKYNSLNTRFFLLNKCFNEIRIILNHLGCHSSTINLSCGFGDFCLTSLSDLSRNRTLGLVIAKGFYSVDVLEKNSVVLEGVRTLQLLNASFKKEVIESLPILKSLIDYFILKSSNNLSVDFDKIMDTKFKTVLTYGTFDLLHYGHLEILKRAKGFGDRLVVGLSTDEFNLQKGKVCEFTYEKRKQYLESLDYVDLVIPESNWDQKADDVTKYSVEYFVMGDDWKGKFDFLEDKCKVVYLPRTEGISTTQMKEILRNNK
jgi:glycerol-3-phosphate cytidylyltransferase